MTGLVRAELKKIGSTRLWWGLLIPALVMAVVQSVAYAVLAGGQPGPGAPAIPSLETAEAVRLVYPTAMFEGVYVFALVLGITGMTGEYRYQTITSTFLVCPRRSRVVVAKILAHVVLGLVYGVLGMVTVLAAGGAAMSIRGYGLGLDAGGLWSATALAVVAVATWTVLGIGIGTLIRNQVAAIVIGVLVTFLLEPLATLALSFWDLEWVAMWLPSNASTALTAPGDALGAYLDWWLGGLVLLGYGLVLAAAGVLLSVRRDVS